MKTSFLFILYILTAINALSQGIPLHKDIQETLNITRQVKLFEDNQGNLPIDSVLNKEFQAVNSDYYLIPFSDKALWFKIELDNQDDPNKEWILQFSNELSETLELYRFDSINNSYALTETWDLNSSKSKNFKGQEPYFRFVPERQETVYLKLKNQRGIRSTLHIFPASIYTDVLLDYQGERQFLYGLLIFRLLLVLTLGLFIIKERAFRAYSMFILIKTFGYWGIINVMNPDFVSSIELAGKVNFLFYAGTAFGVILFCLLILPLDKLPGWIKTALFVLLGLATLSHIMVWTSYNWHYLYMGMFVVLATSLFAIGIFIYTAYLRLPIQKFYSIPFLLGIAGYILMNIQVLFLVRIPLAQLMTFFFFVAEILVFIYFLGRIFNQTQLKGFMADQQLENERIQSEKLMELDNLKTSFFTNISHELKTPLTLISGPLAELKKRYPSEKLLDMMQPNVTRLRELVSQILDIQKLDSGKEPPVIIKADLARQIRLQVLSFDSLATAKKIKLSLSQSKESFEACFDDDKLNKILSNLLSNAIKYSPEQSEVVVNVQYDVRPKRVSISVADSGFGIPEKDIIHIFDKFYQVNSQKHQGSGVGLSLVKELVDLLLGKIQVFSNTGVGTTFLVELPADEKTWENFMDEETRPSSDFIIPEKTIFIPQAHPENGVRNQEKKLILLVEDNPDMQEYLFEILHEEYDLIQAFDGKEGILKAGMEVPDLIITDLMMPEMDGLEFSRKIRENVASSHVPIIMLTAKSDKTAKLEGFEIGIDHYLTKPFDPDELLIVISNCLTNRARLREIFSKNIADPVLEMDKEANRWEKAFIAELQDFLELNYQDSSLSVPDIATKMNMSESQLRRKLKSISSYSPNEYIRKFRLQKAHQLLETTETSVSEIAFKVGFENLSYFSKIFQAEFEMSPSEVQRN